MSSFTTEELLTIVKDGFEEQKQIKVLSLYIEEDIIQGIYVLPLEQSLSFQEEPLLDMVTDIGGYTIIMEELGQLLLYAYNFGSILHYCKIMHTSDINITDTTYDELINICSDNPPLQRIDANLIEWFTRTDDIHKIRTQNFVKICNRYNQLDSINFDDTISVTTHDDNYILKQFKEVTEQIQNKNHSKITELIIHNINQLYIKMQVDLYITDNK